MTDAADLEFRGLVALVTGAGGGGGGTAVVRHLISRGVDVAANVRTDESLSDETREALRGSRIVIGDVSSEAGAARVVELAAVAGRLDILVHNAAPSLPKADVEDLATSQWREELAVIIDAAFFLSRAAIPLMRVNGFGRLILISSNAATRGARGRSGAYSAGKAGLHGLAAQLALELGPHGITANVVAPSQLDTARVRSGGRRTDASMAEYARCVPVGRVGTPQDLATLVGFLAGRTSGYLTGQVICLDGGSSLSQWTTTTQDEEERTMMEVQADKSHAEDESPSTRLGVGTYHLTSDRGVDHGEAIRIVRAALDCRIEVFDVAPMYGAGEAEQILGEALRSADRKDAYVVNKVGRFEKSIMMRLGEAAYQDPHAIRAQFDHSMRLLGLETLPLLLIHETEWDQWWPEPERVAGPVMDVVKQLKEEGRLGAVGLSVRDSRKATRLCESGLFDAMLFVHYYNMIWQEAGATAIAAADAVGMNVLVGAVFRQGLLTTTDPAVPARLREERKSANPPGIIDRIEAAQDISRSFGIPMTELGLRWLGADPRINTILVGPRTVDELHENVAALARGDLDPSVVAALRDLRDIPVGAWS